MPIGWNCNTGGWAWCRFGGHMRRSFALTTSSGRNGSCSPIIKCVSILLSLRECYENQPRHRHSGRWHVSCGHGAFGVAHRRAVLCASLLVESLSAHPLRYPERICFGESHILRCPLDGTVDRSLREATGPELHAGLSGVGRRHPPDERYVSCTVEW